MMISLNGLDFSAAFFFAPQTQHLLHQPLGKAEQDGVAAGLRVQGTSERLDDESHRYSKPVFR